MIMPKFETIEKTDKFEIKKISHKGKVRYEAVMQDGMPCKWILADTLDGLKNKLKTLQDNGDL